MTGAVLAMPQVQVEPQVEPQVGSQVGLPQGVGVLEEELLCVVVQSTLDKVDCSYRAVGIIPHDRAIVCQIQGRH